MRAASDARTIYGMFQETVALHGNRPALGFHAARGADYTYWTYRDLDERVRTFAARLLQLGLRRGDRLGILMENRAEWAIADLAAQAIGLITVAPYATLPAAQVAQLLRQSGVRVVIVSDAKQRAKIEAHRTELPALERLITVEPSPEQQDGLLLFGELLCTEANATADTALEAAIAEVRPDDIGTLIYTSGTSGEPKGAMLSQTALLHTPNAVLDEPIADIGPNDVVLSFLPLSHITERLGGHYLPLRCGACIVYSLGLLTLAEEIGTVRPTVMLCVPRLFESMQEKARDRIAKLPPRNRAVAEWALAIGSEWARRRSAGRPISPLLALQRAIAEKLALRKIRDAVTGGRIRYFVSGGAPLNAETATFFLGLGVQILEGYGLSESGIICVNRPGRQRIGTVGTVLPHVELRLAADGEILMRGPGRMTGYWERPESTTEAIDPEGWLHTGDIGQIDKDGYLAITDRKKDLLVLANGKKVARQPIEARLKRSPLIGEAVLLGDGQPTVMAIIVPAFDKLLAWAKGEGLATSDVAGLVSLPEVQRLYKQEIDRNTTDLADFEKIKRFKLASNPFTIDSGELTPTLKVKRRFVAEKYADLVAAMQRG